MLHVDYISLKPGEKIIGTLTLLLTVLNLNLEVQIYFQVLLIRLTEIRIRLRKRGNITLFKKLGNSKNRKN